jgi:hypothetical protein
MTIWFDMDGTIADLYGVPNWLEKLMAEDATPYAEAAPLLRLAALARILNRLQREGYKLGIVSWLSKGATPQYQRAVAKAKIEWLQIHLRSVRFDHIDIIEYGTPKHIGRKGILFDDEEKNRTEWGEGAYDVNNILEVLKTF